MKNTINSQVHLMTVDNNDDGRKTIANLRKSMKESNSTLRMILYGRGHRFGKGRMHVCKCGNPARTGPRSCGCRWWDNEYQSSIPLDKAQKIAVFVTRRGGRARFTN